VLTVVKVIAGVVTAFAVIGIAIGRNGRDTVLLVTTALVYGISTGGDVAECSQVVEIFFERHNISKDSKSAPGRAPVFCDPRSKGYVFETPPTVIIYGVAKKTSQEQYLAALNAIRLNMGIKQLRVKFYEQENWIEWGSKETGVSGGDRGAERLIRKETLASIGVTPVA
jgi:hypothetical protein